MGFIGIDSKHDAPNATEYGTRSNHVDGNVAQIGTQLAWKASEDCLCHF